MLGQYALGICDYQQFIVVVVINLLQAANYSFSPYRFAVVQMPNQIRVAPDQFRPDSLLETQVRETGEEIKLAVRYC